MKKSIIVIGLLLTAATAAISAEDCFVTTECIVTQGTSKAIPQAPRVSPNGQKLLYELYTKDQCEIWVTDADGKNAMPLTSAAQQEGRINRKVENAFWHPSGNYITFNGVPEGINKSGTIYVARITETTLGDLTAIDQGARAQFSRPNGNVLFYEHTANRFGDRGFYNTLFYRILGSDPLHPVDNTTIGLRGPIQSISQSTELSHPSLAPDGTTILFAARPSASGEILSMFNINDGNRQRAVELLKKLRKMNISDQDILKDISACSGVDIEYMSLSRPAGWAEGAFTDLKTHLDENGGKATIVPGYTKRDLVIAWLLGLLDIPPDAPESDVQKILLSRIWMTDVFGAPIVPLVDDLQNVPLPQKWATVSSSGHFAVFEAGDYHDRHLYLVNIKNHKAIKLTDQGTYNSSPEISTDEQWVYFESNRNGQKCIWRAKLDHAKIQAQVQPYE